MSAVVDAVPPLARASPATRPRTAWAEPAFAFAARSAALAILLLLGGILAALVAGSAPALREFGWGFLWTAEWDPVREQFGALVPIVGTIATSAIALAIAVPVSFGIAVFLTETCPTWLRRPLGTMIELLAAIPSIIYGMWGLFVFAPLFQAHVQPLAQGALGWIPGIGALVAGPPMGIGLLTAGIVLAIMVIPFIAAVMRDVFALVPPLLRESAYGMGATRWEVVWNVVLPYARAGVAGGVMLGLGRALGETMAVTFVIGNAHRLDASLFAPGSSISSALANEFTEAVGAIHTAALVELGLILFLLTSVVLACTRLLLRFTSAAGAATR